MSIRIIKRPSLIIWYARKDGEFLQISNMAGRLRRIGKRDAEYSISAMEAGNKWNGEIGWFSKMIKAFMEVQNRKYPSINLHARIFT